MASKVHQFPGTRPAPPEEPEVDIDTQLVKLKEHFDEVVKEVMEDPGPNTTIMTILSTDTQTTTLLRKLGDGMDLPGIAFGMIRAQHLIGEQGGD